VKRECNLFLNETGKRIIGKRKETDIEEKKLEREIVGKRNRRK